MWIIGMDLAGPTNSADTALAAFCADADHLVLQQLIQGLDDYDIFNWMQQYVPQTPCLVVGLDAPLSYNVGGGDRPADKDLRQQAQRLGLPGGTIMPPTLTRMAYLTLRGIVISRLLELRSKCGIPKENLKIVEVHPASCLGLHGAVISDIIALKRSPESRVKLLTWLEQQGMYGLSVESTPSDHQVAACAAAFGAWQWVLGKSVWLYPATLPFHPYDFAC